MSRPGPGLPWGASTGAEPRDAAIAARLVDLSTEHGRLVPLQTYHRDPLVAVGHDTVLHLASGPTASAQLRREAASRDWALSAGVRVPAWDLLEGPEGHGCSLISARVSSDPGSDRGYAEAAIAASRAVSAARVAPPAGGRTWRASKRTRPVRLSRALLSPLRLQETRLLRQAVTQLPADGWAHGDFRNYNVLYDAHQGHVHLIDWEYVGRAWRGSDLLALWACLDEPEVTDLLLEAVVADRGADQAPQVGLVLLWSCVRLLAEQVTGSPLRERDRARIARVQARVVRARELAKELGTTLL